MASTTRFSIENFIPITQDGQSLDIFKAKFREIRSTVREQQRVVIDAAYAGNLPGLAHKYLDNTSLWWAILLYNGLQDPLDDVKVGMTIKIPSRSDLIAVMESAEVNQKAMRI